MGLRWLFGLVVLCLGALAASDAPAQQAEARIALIIANEAYVGGAFQPLPGTQQDAAVMRPALERAGFTVTVQRNVNRQQLRDALADFARQLAALGDRGVGFLYYSGHGVGQRGENFLIPVDARVQGVTDLPLAAVPLGEQLEALEYASARSVVIVLDACRTAFGRGARGLAPVSARTDTLIAFSTQPNELAADDGLYARVLAEEITRPGADTTTAFARVTRSVANATGRAQVPRHDSGLIEPVVFVAAAPTDQVARQQQPPPPQAPQSVRAFRDCAGCPEMVHIPRQSFAPGQSSAVAFAVGRYEVTFAEWDACVAAGGCGRDGASDEGWGRGNRPVVNVSWDDAQAYVRWLSLHTGQRYRLLSSAEWEIAASGATTTYSWGNDPPVCVQGARNGANFADCTDDRTRPVGSFQPNEFGIYDLHGNVWEWVEDCYDSCSVRVVRGGSWLNDAAGLGFTERGGNGPASRRNLIGFRVAKTL